MRTMIAILCVCLLSPAMVLGADFTLADPGSEDIVRYGKYGEFSGIGTDTYSYTIKDLKGLKKAVGEGIYPNASAVTLDPLFQTLKKEGKLDGNHWDFVMADDHAAGFFRWAVAQEDAGTKLFYAAQALERSGNLVHAIKAYYALVVHFPRTVGETYWKTPWYMGQVAVSRIQNLTRLHPELKMKLEGARIKVINGSDSDKGNDVFIVNPGTLKKVKDGKGGPDVELKGMAVKKTIGGGTIRLVQYENGHWELRVDGKPYLVHGMAYSPSKVGLTPDNGSLNVSRDWSYADSDGNGILDGPYEAWVDTDRADREYSGEKKTGDFALMKEMGVNTLRIYHYEGLNKQLLKEGYERYGFRCLMGNFLGMYATGSGADWFSGTDYSDPKQRAVMLADVRNMVMEYKDEPYVLMWVLGNENNYAQPGKPGVSSGNGCRANLQPKEYYSFVNEAALLIKSIDPYKRPVAVCNGDVLYLDHFARYAPDIDVFGANAYRGDAGFGSLWEDVTDTCGLSVLITEYGCPAYHKSWTGEKAENAQAHYHRGCWTDIAANAAGYGVGNSIGGVVFEWVDEWWKAGPPPEFDPSLHDRAGQFGGPFPDGWSYEEWYGICSQGSGLDSPFRRQLRPAYEIYKKLWNTNGGDREHTEK